MAASSGMYNQGLGETGKNSSSLAGQTSERAEERLLFPTSGIFRVLRPPGGGSSFSIFGAPDPPAPTKKRPNPSPPRSAPSNVSAQKQQQEIDNRQPAGKVKSEPDDKPGEQKANTGQRTSSKVLAPPGGRSSLKLFG